MKKATLEITAGLYAKISGEIRLGKAVMVFGDGHPRSGRIVGMVSKEHTWSGRFDEVVIEFRNVVGLATYYILDREAA